MAPSQLTLPILLSAYFITSIFASNPQPVLEKGALSWANNPTVGLEILEPSRYDHNLDSKSLPTVEQKKTQLFGRKNSVASAVTIVISLLNIAAYQIRRSSQTNPDSSKSRSSSSCRQFSIDEIRSATNWFNDESMIGSGGFGRVYKGGIDGGATRVAIKRLKSESRQGEKEFQSEIRMLSKLRHEHIVPLIGYCNDGEERVLVYEYMTGGTLEDHLHKLRRRGIHNPPLSWEQRLKISIGAAHGLYFLHTCKRRVVHRDVKSSNILLDENWVAKISDFGLSKMGAPNESFSNISTNVKGTFGYIDPECFLTRKITRKSDVYAFGVVLFEMLSVRPAVDLRLNEKMHSLASWARYCKRKEKIDELIDRDLRDQISPACLNVFVGIAGRCIDEHPRERPAMADVVVSLELALRLQQTPSSGQEFDEEAENINYSEQSNGAFSFNNLSIHPSNEEIAQNDTAEVSGTSPETEEPTNLKNTWSRWWWPWWDVFGLFTRPAAKRKASQSLPINGLRKFSVKEIRNATNHFHDNYTIGFRGSERLYKFQIDGIKRVAVRRSRKQTDLQTTHALDLVSLLGYCQHKTETIFIYESVANGSLHDHLSDPYRDHLPWKRRLQICIGIAEGLSHHHSTVKHSNLHCTLKSTNILLDNNWAAMILDSHSCAPTGGNWGHLESDYLRDDKTREKSYVFSFGLMLFEVLCGTKGSTWWLDEGQVSLAQWIKAGLRHGLSGCIDPCLAGKIFPQSLSKFVEAAGKCLVDEGSHRPSMSDMVASLEAALQLQEAAENVKGFEPSN